MSTFSWRFVTLAAFFVTALVVSNIIAVKLAEVGGRVFDAGNILFPLAFGSSVVGQAIDSTLFVTIAFAGTGAPLLDTIVTTWAIKVAWETLATPFTYLIANGLKRTEGVDVFDGPRPTGARV